VSVRVEIRRGGERITEGFDPFAGPAQTITHRFNRWQVNGGIERMPYLLNNTSSKACRRADNEPAPTMFFGGRLNKMVWEGQRQEVHMLNSWQPPATTGPPWDAIDLFAGPGGWDVAATRLGLDVIGVEFDDAACATRKAAGLATWQGDVAAVGNLDRRRGKVGGLIASPPCPGFSAAGKGLGRKDMPHIVECLRELGKGRDTREHLRSVCLDERSPLTVEPLRWALAMQPTWLAWEQVPAVLPLWEKCAEILRYHGWHVATAKLYAEEYGVPQTRQRAILIAHREREVSMPEPTHQRYRKGKMAVNGHPMPVTMAQALGWTEGVQVNTRGERKTPGGNDFSADGPALTEKARSWKTHIVGAGRSGEGRPRPIESEPAPSLSGKGTAYWLAGEEVYRNGRTQADDRAAAWEAVGGWDRPATSVQGDPRISRPGHHGAGDERDPAPRQQTGAIRVTEQEAAILQSFPADYPWQGTRTKRFQQIGNAIPPLLAEHILRAVAL
jgi:DNA (cytosine-5)-methyltransferase 1